MLKEIRFYPFYYIFYWFLPFEKLSSKKKAEFFEKDSKNFLRTDLKETIYFEIPKNIIYFFKYGIVFFIFFLLDAFSIKFETEHFIILILSLSMYLFFMYSKIKIYIKWLIIISFILFIVFLYIYTRNNQLIINFFLFLKYLIPIHLVIFFIKDIKLRKDYLFLKEELLVVEIIK